VNTYSNRIVAAAAAGAIALTSIALTPAMAAPVNKKPTVSADNTDFSSRRRYRGGNRAAFGAMVGVIGTIAALSARDRYYNGYGPYYSGYAPYRRPYYAPYAYGGPYPYGAPVLRPNPWGGSYGYYSPY
jgi:hypothetical protein